MPKYSVITKTCDEVYQGEIHGSQESPHLRKTIQDLLADLYEIIQVGKAGILA
jgi:hypothetical protein